MSLIQELTQNVYKYNTKNNHNWSDSIDKITKKLIAMSRNGDTSVAFTIYTNIHLDITIRDICVDFHPISTTLHSPLICERNVGSIIRLEDFKDTFVSELRPTLDTPCSEVEVVANLFGKGPSSWTVTYKW